MQPAFLPLPKWVSATVCISGDPRAEQENWEPRSALILQRGQLLHLLGNNQFSHWVYFFSELYVRIEPKLYFRLYLVLEVCVFSLRYLQETTRSRCNQTPRGSSKSRKPKKDKVHTLEYFVLSTNQAYQNSVVLWPRSADYCKNASGNLKCISFHLYSFSLGVIRTLADTEWDKDVCKETSNDCWSKMSTLEMIVYYGGLWGGQ